RRRVDLIDEKKLLMNLKRRRRDALEAVIALYTPYVSVIAYNIIGSAMTREDIEEVIADTFIGLWKHADSLDQEKGTIRGYLGAAARNCAKNKLREVRVHMELDENIAAEKQEILEDLEQKEERRFLVDMISALGEPDSEIFMRYYYYDEKISRISKITGICDSTVKTKLVRGRQKLKNMIMQKRGEDDE
ncbi:MAG: sigma-70 family RNA polymerase sigma factor, partial [Anaerovorax sp.]